ncbi:MAG: copper chaperone [Bacteroidia bacterium]|jgi:copper chaperone
MKAYKFKTTINCGSCLNTVTPILNTLDNVDAWKVDISHPDKVLEVTLDDDNVNAVINSVKSAGFEIEPV